jgi:hypothetical protein
MHNNTAADTDLINISKRLIRSVNSSSIKQHL